MLKRTQNLQILLIEILRIDPIVQVEVTQTNFAYFQPLQQFAVASLVKGG